jgi:hypothetical protein
LSVGICLVLGSWFLEVKNQEQETKHQTKPKTQTTNDNHQRPQRSLVIERWNLFDSWFLVLGG